MKTDDLIALLATGAAPVDRRAAPRRLALASAAAVGAALLLMWLLLGLNPQLPAYLALPMFWVKAGFGVLVAAAATLALQRLARPGWRLSWVGAGLALPFAAVWALGLAALLAAPPAERMHDWMGSTWTACMVWIALLAVPGVVAALWLLRSMAPTRPVLAGAVAGLWAGGIAAFAYALHCPELAAPFIASWYALGIAIPAALGAALGPRLLRW